VYTVLTDLNTHISDADLLQLVDDDDEGAIVQSPPNKAYGRVIDAAHMAQTLIDSYCRGRYTVPLDPIPDIISDISADLTIYFCMMRKKEIAMSPEQDRRYNAAIKTLKSIQEGEIQLYDNIAPPPRFVTNKTADSQVFTEDVLRRF
jgi:phage gp36-like protein